MALDVWNAANAPVAAPGRRRLVHAAWNKAKDVGTITAETEAGKRFAVFGRGSLIAFPSGSVYGEPWIELGEDTMIAEWASVCAGMMPGHDLGPSRYCESVTGA